MRRPPIDTSGLEIVGLACSPKIKDRQTGESLDDLSVRPVLPTSGCSFCLPAS